MSINRMSVFDDVDTCTKEVYNYNPVKEDMFDIQDFIEFIKNPENRVITEDDERFNLLDQITETRAELLREEKLCNWEGFFECFCTIVENNEKRGSSQPNSAQHLIFRVNSAYDDYKNYKHYYDERIKTNYSNSNVNKFKNFMNNSVLESHDTKYSLSNVNDACEKLNFVVSELRKNNKPVNYLTIKNMFDYKISDPTVSATEEYSNAISVIKYYYAMSNERFIG